MMNIFPQHSRSSNSDEDSGCALEEYAWCPPGLKAEQVRQFFKSFPEDKIPFLNSLGEKYRTKMLEEQLPPHDSDPKYCRTLTEDEKNELKIFNEQQRHNALGRGTARQLPLTQSPLPCRGCHHSIDSGSICVHAERAGRNGVWHPECFTCTQCKEFLVNLIYFFKDGKLYCGRHHAELFKPRCTACDEIIFSDECTEAEGYSWHMDHFSCSSCQKRLGGERYVMRQNQPFCLNCFETMYAEYCDTCGERIETDQAQMSHESQHWHATDSCFYCYTCRLPLLNRGFFPRYGALFCSNECSLHRPNRSMNQKYRQQQRFDQGPDIIPTSYTQTTQHVRILPARSKNYNEIKKTSRSKDSTGYVSDVPNGTRSKREFNNGYLSDGTGTRRQRSSQPQVFLRFQTSPDSVYSTRQSQEKINMNRTRSREPIQFYNDLNLEQLDRDGATLEIARCSTSKSSRSSLPDLSGKKLNSKNKSYSTNSQETLVEQPIKPQRVKHFDTNDIMYPISRPKSTAYSTISAQFPRSRSLNGSARYPKQHHVRFVDDVKKKRSPTRSFRSKKNHSSSSSSEDEDEEEDTNSIYQQFDIYGNRLRRPMKYGTKISYVDECGFGPNVMTKNSTLTKKEKKSSQGRKKKDCIIS